MNTSYPDIRLHYTGNTKTHKTVDDNGTEEEEGNEVKGWYGNATVQKEGSVGEKCRSCMCRSQIGRRDLARNISNSNTKGEIKIARPASVKMIRQPNTGNWQLEHSW